MKRQQNLQVKTSINLRFAFVFEPCTLKTTTTCGQIIYIIYCKCNLVSLCHILMVIFQFATETDEYFFWFSRTNLLLVAIGQLKDKNVFVKISF